MDKRECSKCEEVKELSEYSFRKDSGTYRVECKSCRSVQAKSYREENKVDVNRRSRERWNEPDSKKRISNRLYKTENLEAVRQWDRDRYERDKPKRIAGILLRTQYKAKRTPCWYSSDDDKAYADLVEQQHLLKDAFGLDFHIDHIVPLKGKTVSGLHIKENWQLITAAENLRKGNFYQ